MHAFLHDVIFYFCLATVSSTPVDNTGKYSGANWSYRRRHLMSTLLGPVHFYSW